MEYLRGEKSLGDGCDVSNRLSVERRALLPRCVRDQWLAHQGVTLWRDSETTSELVLVIHRDPKPDNTFQYPQH